MAFVATGSVNEKSARRPAFSAEIARTKSPLARLLASRSGSRPSPAAILSSEVSRSVFLVTQTAVGEQSRSRSHAPRHKRRDLPPFQRPVSPSRLPLLRCRSISPQANELLRAPPTQGPTAPLNSTPPSNESERDLRQAEPSASEAIYHVRSKHELEAAFVRASASHCNDGDG